MAQNLFAPNKHTKASLVYIHFGAKSANAVRQDFSRVINNSKFKSANSNAILATYKNRLRKQLTSLVKNGEQISLDELTSTETQQILDAMAATLTEKLASSTTYQKFLQTAQSFSAQQKTDLTNSVQLDKFINSFSEVLDATGAFSKKGRNLIASLLKQKIKATNNSSAIPQTFTEQELVSIKYQTEYLSKVTRTLNTFLENYAAGLNDKQNRSRAIGSAIGTLLSGDFGEMIAAKETVFSNQQIHKTVTEAIPKLVGTATPRDDFGGMGKTDFIAKNLSFSMQVNSNQYELIGDFEFSVKTYLSNQNNSRSKVFSIQNSNSLIKRLASTYTDFNLAEWHAIYNTLAFSQAKPPQGKSYSQTISDLQDAAAPAYRVITKGLLENLIIDFLTGTGTGFKQVQGQNFTPFIMINGQVYSTLSILIKALEQFKNSFNPDNPMAENNIIYISASRYENKWIGKKNVADEQKAQERSHLVQTAINQISMNVNFNLNNYLASLGKSDSKIYP